MGIIKKTVCPNCGGEYSALRSDCPYCGARKPEPSARAPRSSDAVRSGSPQYARAEANTGWQLIIGLCLVAAVIISVIVLISTTINGSYDDVVQASPSASVSPTPSASPTPTPTPTPAVESITITFLGQERKEFTANIGVAVQLGATVYPLESEGPLAWSSSDETILTVDETGLVTPVKAGIASVIVRCYGGAAECKVVVR